MVTSYSLLALCSDCGPISPHRLHRTRVSYQGPSADVDTESNSEPCVDLVAGCAIEDLLLATQFDWFNGNLELNLTMQLRHLLHPLHLHQYHQYHQNHCVPNRSRAPCAILRVECTTMRRQLQHAPPCVFNFSTETNTLGKAGFVRRVVS